MNKARRELAERFRASDMVIELLDARAPIASANPMLERLRGELPRLCLVTKADLADPAVTARWLETLRREGVRAREVTSTDRNLRTIVTGEGRALCPERIRRGFPVRAMIVGIPNVGKSTLFNTLLEKRKANVENRPAVTRQQQLAEVSRDLVLVDTPGVLWPKLENQRAAACLAAIGSIGEGGFDAVLVARFALGVLLERYPGAVDARFGVTNREADPLEGVARRRGCLMRGAGFDLAKAAGIVLSELKSGRAGRVSLETPEDYRNPE
jgi:ribosome biogenesis GTPase A